MDAYFDESGTHRGSRIVALGGYVGTKAAWKALEPDWRAILAEFAGRGVKDLHTTDAIAQKEQFAGIDKPMLNYILTQLAQRLGKSDVTPLFSAVVHEDWDAVEKPPEFLKRFPSPIYLCFENLIQTLARWAREYAKGELVVPTFAIHPEYTPGMAQIGALYAHDPAYQKVLGPLAFDYPSRVVPLQAADLFVHQQNWDIERRAYGPFSFAEGGPGTKALYWATGGRYTHGNWFEKTGLEITIKRFRETGEI